MAAEIKQNEQAPTGVIRMMLNDGNYYEVNVPDVRSACESGCAALIGYQMYRGSITGLYWRCR